MAQFETVGTRYGAPMGRREYGTNPEPKSVRLFRVRLDSGGYDDGGAYWGGGQALWCATDDADYRRFVRADGQLSAIVALELEAGALKRRPLSKIARLKALEASGRASARGTILRQKLEELGF